MNTVLRQTLLLLTCLMMAGQLLAEDKTLIKVENMSIHLEEGIYLIDADIKIALKNPLLEALNSGVNLEFVVNYEIVRSRRWWVDKEVAELSQRYQISYHALSRQYLLTNLNTRNVDTFYNLDQLMESLGLIRGFPLLDASLLRENKVYRIRMRAYFDYDELPIPLRMRAYSSSAWRPDSGWLVWPLR